MSDAEEALKFCIQLTHAHSKKRKGTTGGHALAHSKGKNKEPEKAAKTQISHPQGSLLLENADSNKGRTATCPLGKEEVDPAHMVLTLLVPLSIPHVEPELLMMAEF
eukprot:1157356-Pelagomonas_calceolata.AAC.14